MTAPSMGYLVPILATMLLLIAVITIAIRRVRPDAAAWAALLLGAWLVVAITVAGTGLLRGAGRLPPIGLGLASGLPILIGVLAITRIPSVRALALGIPQTWLISMHLVRVVGGLFVWIYLQGQLPASFALPAGLGDVAVALAAPFVAWAYARRMPYATAALWIWNLAGIADFADAVALGVTSSQGPLRLFHGGPSAEALALLPLAIIPTFGVPLIALLHVASMTQLRSKAREAVIAPNAVPTV